MELRQLRYFVAVVDAGSVSHACASLGVAQPTLSQAMSTLESELGTALLTRSQRGVAPTDGGDALYRHALRILRLIDELPDVVRQRRQSTAGRVRLGMPISIGTMVAPALIAQLRVTYPDISLEIDEHMAANYGASHLLNDRMDLSVLLNDESLASEIVSTPFLHERFWFVRKRDDGAPLPRSVTLDTVVEYPLILTTRTTSFRAVIARQFAQFNLKPTVAAESNSGQTIASMVADGVGASLLPYSVFGPSPRAAELEYCPVEPAFFRIATLAHVKAAPLSMACESVRALMYELATRMIHAGEWPGASMSRRG